MRCNDWNNVVVDIVRLEDLIRFDKKIPACLNKHAGYT
jgi:hypothetical protein